MIICFTVELKILHLLSLSLKGQFTQNETYVLYLVSCHVHMQLSKD